MKTLTVLVILASLLTGLILFRLSGVATSVADTAILDNEVTNSISHAGNSSASATITITMYAAGDE